MSYTFSFIPPSVRTIETADATFSVIDMPGCIGLGRRPGDPTLPVKFIQLLLPPMETVDSVTVIDSPFELRFPGNDLTREHIYPAQDEIPIGTVAPSEVVLNQELYSSYDLYPDHPYREYHIGYSHGYAVFDIALQPVQLIPAEGRLFYYPQMTVQINLRENGEVNPFFRGNPEDEAWVKSLVYNPEVAKRYVDLPTFEYPRGIIASRPIEITTTVNFLILNLGKTTSTVKAVFVNGTTVKKPSSVSS